MLTKTRIGLVVASELFVKESEKTQFDGCIFLVLYIFDCISVQEGLPIPERLDTPMDGLVK